MNRIDYYKIGFLLLIPLLVFFPAFYTHYFYTDEIVQLWLYRKGSDFNMFIPQGRLLNNGLFRFMYSNIDTIDQLVRLHVFALVSWLISLPVWYFVFAQITKKEGLPVQLPFFATLFLVTSLPFGIAIQWAACMELPIAYTCGLLAGYLVYRYDRRGWLPAMLLGLIAAFFYQNGVGCFLLPFFLRFIAGRRADKSMLPVLFFYFSIYLVYFLLFKVLSSTVLHVGISDRAAFANNPFTKAYFFVFKVLPSAFHFNMVIPETSMPGRLVFFVIAGACLWVDFTRLEGIRDRLIHTLLIIGAFGLIYLPSMIIKENYASNRTMLGMDLAAFLWVFSTLMRLLQEERLRWRGAVTVGVLLIAISLYNYRVIFLPPAVHEYTAMKTFFDRNYDPKTIHSVTYIREGEENVRSQYHVGSSWDEYGFYSSYFAWVPEFFSRQLVFEKTGSRALGEQLEVKVWIDRKAWQASGQQVGPGNLFVDAPAILSK